MEMTLEDYLALMEHEPLEIYEPITEEGLAPKRRFIGSGEDVDLEMLYGG